MNNTIRRAWNPCGMVRIEELSGMAFQSEDGGHTFEIYGTNDSGGSVPLSGTVTATFMRPDNVDIAMNGTITNGVASVTLDDDCYLVPGRFQFTVFLAADSKKTAIYAALGIVSRTSGGAVAGDIPASVDELLAEINEYSALLESVANGHGGIKKIEKTGSTGTNPVVDTYTLTYADDTTFLYYVTNGIQGPVGPAASVSSQAISYQQSTSGTTVPTGTWQSSVPAVSQGNFLWTRTQVTFSDNTTVTSYSVSRMGIDGAGSVSSVNSVSPASNGNVTLTPADIGAASVTDGKVTASEASSAIVSTSDSFTLALSDAGKMIIATASSDIVVTIPTNASVAFPVGTEIEVARLGTGSLSFEGASGVTILSMSDMVEISDQYGVAGLKKVDTNTWLLVGALA